MHRLDVRTRIGHGYSFLEIDLQNAEGDSIDHADELGKSRFRWLKHIAETYKENRVLSDVIGYLFLLYKSCCLARSVRDDALAMQVAGSRGNHHI